jgi:hypothetical protein
MSKNVRTAQFGGVGGGGTPSPFTPGSKPMGVGKSQGQNSAVNMYINEDDNFEKILSRTHQDNEYNDDNIETKLTMFHKQNVEMGFINYELTPLERLQAKYRSILHNYKLNLEKEADSLLKNSPGYIKENLKTDKKHLQTMEQSLEARHKYNTDTKYPREEYKDPDQPSRSHFALTEEQLIRIAFQVANNDKEDYAIGLFGSEVTDPVPGEQRKFDQRFKQIPEMSYVTLDGDDGFQGLNKYLDNSANSNRDGTSSKYNEPTIQDYPNPDGKANISPAQLENKPAPGGQYPNANDPNMTTEQKMHKNKMPTTYRDFIDADGEKTTTESIYPGSVFFGNLGHSV